eukprot:7830903-Alexandrium_andersonii.AAC.1
MCASPSSGTLTPTSPSTSSAASPTPPSAMSIASRTSAFRQRRPFNAREIQARRRSLTHCSLPSLVPVSYTHLRAHETSAHL